MQIVHIALCTLVLGLAQTSLAGPAEDFAALLDEAWEWQLKENPMMASGLGDRRYNDAGVPAPRVRHRPQCAQRRRPA